MWPDCSNDLVEDHGCGFEEFGKDGVFVVEDGSARFVALLVLEQYIP